MDAKSWIGFEHRIQERRFRALLDAIAAASARGDGVSARIALEEARELRPEAPELAEAEARVALLPVVIPAVAAPGFFRSRTFNAVALLLVGVALLTGLDAVRSGAPVAEPDAVSEPAAIAEPGLSPAIDIRAETAGAPVFESESLVTEPPPSSVVEQPVLIPVPAGDDPEPVDTIAVGTAGLSGRAPSRAAAESAPVRPVVQPALLVESAAEPAPRALPDPLPRTDIPDEPIVLPVPQPRREAIVASPVLSRAARGPVLVPPAPADGSASRDAAAASAAAVTNDETLVSSVLNRYAQAYDALDASAAREVWPTVDERALAKAFAGLQSQHVAFDDCRIDVRGEVANASCRGLASYVGKVGSREPRTEPRRWTFELRRDGEAWKIQTAEATLTQ